MELGQSIHPFYDGVADDAYSLEDNWTDESYDYESSENQEGVERIAFDLEIHPMKKDKGRGKTQEYTWPSERNYKPLKNYKP